MRLVRLGDDDHSGRLPVKAVDDAGPLHAADPAQAPRAVREQRVDKRVLARARPRVDDHPGGLVDREEPLVLEEDIEPDVDRP